MRVFGIDVAPLHKTPLQRRLQTLSVQYLVTVFLFLGTASSIFLLYLLLYTKYYWIPLAYSVWFFYDRDICNCGGRRSEWLRNWAAFRYFAEYFPISLVKTHDLDPKQNYLLAGHPHGILSFSHFTCFASEGNGFSKKFPGITPHLLTLEGQFWFPFFREFFLMTGACSASKKSLDCLLTHPDKGHAPLLIIGGAAEAFNAKPGDTTITLVLRKRRGFIRVALEHGVPLVPVFSFGETDVLNQVDNPEGSYVRRLQTFLKRFTGFAPIILLGRGTVQYSFGYLPHRRPVTVVVGRPIDVGPPNPNPSHEVVDKLHEKYLEELTTLFEENKKLHNPELKLVIS